MTGWDQHRDAGQPGPGRAEFHVVQWECCVEYRHQPAAEAAAEPEAEAELELET